MRWLLVLWLVTGCGSSDGAGHLADAPGPTDAAPDAGCPAVLLAGGTDVTAQGWTIIQQAPATVTNGADFVQLQTSTPAQRRTSGQLLLRHTLDAKLPLALQIVMAVDAVNPHNALDAAAAFLGSFTPTSGSETDRRQLLYVDPTKVGWADDSQPTFTASLVDGAFHTYELRVDVDHAAHLRIDNADALTRANYAVNGTIAIGDQTNDVNVDSTLRIRSITKLCL